MFASHEHTAPAGARCIADDRRWCRWWDLGRNITGLRLEDVVIPKENRLPVLCGEVEAFAVPSLDVLLQVGTDATRPSQQVKAGVTLNTGHSRSIAEDTNHSCKLSWGNGVSDRVNASLRSLQLVPCLVGDLLLAFLPAVAYAKEIKLVGVPRTDLRPLLLNWQREVLLDLLARELVECRLRIISAM